MSRDRQHLSARADAQLGARRALVHALDELLDNPAHPVVLLEVSLSRFLGYREADLVQRLAHRGASGYLRKALGIAEDGIALAREAVVQLDHGAPDPRPPRCQLDERLLDFGPGVEILEALRQRHSGGAEDLAAARLGAERDELGIDAVERHTEQDGEPAFERRRVEDREVGARAVLDAFPDALDQARALQDLLGERARRGIVGTEERQARPGMARWDSGEEVEVVVQDHRMHGLRGHVDHPGPRIPQPDQQEEQALLVEAHAGQLLELALVEGHGRHDDRGMGLLVAHGEGLPDREEAGLELPERGNLRVQCEIRGKWRLRNHSWSDSSRSRTWRQRWKRNGFSSVYSDV